MRAKRTRDATASSEAILAAAQRAFAEHGFHGARVEEIAGAAGVAKGTVFLHFKDKEGLLLSIVRHHMEKFKALLDGLSDAGRPARKRLEELVNVQQWVRDDATDFRRKMIGMWTSLPTGVRRRLEEFIREGHVLFRNRVAELFREFLGADRLDGVKVELIAAAFLSCVDGLVMRCQMPAVFPSGMAVADAVKLAFIDNLERRAAQARQEKKGKRGK
jgi:AcrR family transcriptional regulator